MPTRIEREGVREMFSDIAPTYDRLNRLLSFGVDRIWRRAAVRALLEDLPLGEPARLLDLATGTGDVALRVRGQLRNSPEVRLVGADFALPMLALGRRKSERLGAGVVFCQADALALPFGDESFDGAIIAFGLRNLEDRRAGLAEMARVLRPGGRLVVLEFGNPAGFFGLIYRAYFRWILPVAGRLISGHPTAYTYLPSTVSEFPSAGALAELMKGAGFAQVRHRPMTGGIAYLHVGGRA